MIPDSRGDYRRRFQMRNLAQRRTDDELKVIISSNTGFPQIETFKITALGVLLEYDVLIAGWRTTRAKGIERTEPDPRFYRKVCGAKRGRIRNLDVSVCSVEIESQPVESGDAGAGAALQTSVVDAEKVM